MCVCMGGTGACKGWYDELKWGTYVKSIPPPPNQQNYAYSGLAKKQITREIVALIVHLQNMLCEKRWVNKDCFFKSADFLTRSLKYLPKIFSSVGYG